MPFYGSIDGVKDNLPKIRKYIKLETDATFADDLDISIKTVERALTEISDQINVALAQRYSVPFADPAPAVITLVANDLAAFKIARSYMTTISAEENQTLNAMRKDAKEILTSLVTGDYEIPGLSRASSSIEQQLEDLNMGSEEEIFDLGDVETWQDKA